jgi:hypothetical protein
MLTIYRTAGNCKRELGCGGMMEGEDVKERDLWIQLIAERTIDLLVLGAKSRDCSSASAVSTRSFNVDPTQRDQTTLGLGYLGVRLDLATYIGFRRQRSRGQVQGRPACSTALVSDPLPHPMYSGAFGTHAIGETTPAGTVHGYSAIACDSPAGPVSGSSRMISILPSSSVRSLTTR